MLARADERLTRGFISITVMRPVFGSTANWMFEPPVSTPTSRMILRAALRIAWYSRSLKVWAGATVTESPVWMPIGSKFSIEQMTTKLSALSRITSSSYSFHPRTDSSIRISWTGDRSRPRSTMASNSSMLNAIPPPVPPSVNEGRMTAGRPVWSMTPRASASVFAKPLFGRSRPIRVIASLKSRRSSPTSTARRLAPMRRMPSRSSTPRRDSSTARFSAVWPPTVGSTASGRSRSRIFSTTSGVSGSTYVRSAYSGSVMIVAGFEFTSETRRPSLRRTLIACVPE